MIERKILLIVILFVLLSCATVTYFGFLKDDRDDKNIAKALANTPWPMFHHGLRHTGLSAYDTSKNSGTLKWKFQTGNDVFSSPAIGSDGTIYVGSNDNYLYAINPDGTLKFRQPMGGAVRSSPAIGSDGTIYVGSDDNYLYAIDPNVGIKWQYKTGDKVLSSPAIDENGTIYVSSEDNYLYAINPDGTLKWKYWTGDLVDSSPAVGSDGTIYVSTLIYGYLYAINPDGTRKWEYDIWSPVISSPAIARDGTIYVGTEDYELYAINPDGALKWKFKTGYIIDSSPAISSDGTIYVGSYDDYLYAIDPDGTLKWKFQTGNDIYSSPAISSDGTVYFGSYDNYLYAINPDGTLKWKFQTGDDIASSPAIGEDGTIYVGSNDNYLYAINAEPSTPPQNLAAHTGNGYTNLTWDPPVDNGGWAITEYRIYRGITSGSEKYLASVEATHLFYNDTPVTNGQKYYYYVTAINVMGESEPGNEVYVKVGASTPPQNLQAKAGDHYVNLIWGAPMDNGGSTIVEYRIFRGTASGGESYLKSVDPSFLFYNDTSVTNGQEYYYYITAFNSIVESDPSNEVNAEPAAKPTPPLNLKLRAGDGYVNLTWQPSMDDGGPGIKEYKIYSGTSSGGETYFTYVPASQLWYNDTMVTNGQIYYYYVTAVNYVQLESDPSNEEHATPQTGVTVPSAPQNLQNTWGTGYVNLTWIAPNNDGGSAITEYKIYRGMSSGGEILIARVHASQLWYNDTLVTGGTTYYYYVTAVNSVGESDVSNESQATPAIPEFSRTIALLTAILTVIFVFVRTKTQT